MLNVKGNSFISLYKWKVDIIQTYVICIPINTSYLHACIQRITDYYFITASMNSDVSMVSVCNICVMC